MVIFELEEEIIIIGIIISILYVLKKIIYKTNPSG